MARGESAVDVIASLVRRVDDLERLTASRLSGTAEAWHYVGAAGEPAFANSWVNYGGGFQTLRFRREDGRRVFVEGILRAGTNGSAVCTLPIGYRPIAGQQRASRGAYSIEAVTFTDITTGGVMSVTLFNGTGAVGAVSLGFSFGLD